MAYEQKPGTGSIFKNERKTEEWHGDYRGEFCDLDGQLFYVDAWRRKPEDNPSGPALRFRVKPKQPRPQQSAPEATEAADLDDAIPF